MRREPNNEFGTHDHEYTDKAFGRRDRRIRSERHPDGGEARYYINDNGLDEKCQGAIFGEFRHSQCTKNGKHEYRGVKFCGTHLPEKVFARHQKREAERQRRWDAEAKERRYRSDLKEWELKCMEALKTIAQGELNDAAGYAAMILSEEPVRGNR